MSTCQGDEVSTGSVSDQTILSRLDQQALGYPVANAPGTDLITDFVLVAFD
jgi:hypothetical protein